MSIVMGATGTIAACKCGALNTAHVEGSPEDVARRFMNARCPLCNSFVADHEYSEAGQDTYGEWILRCWDCDGRPHSHGRPIRP